MLLTLSQVFLLWLLLPASVMANNFELSKSNAWRRPWAVIAANFSHDSPIHLLANLQGTAVIRAFKECQICNCWDIHRGIWLCWLLFQLLLWWSPIRICRIGWNEAKGLTCWMGFLFIVHNRLCCTVSSHTKHILFLMLATCLQLPRGWAWLQRSVITHSESCKPFN